MTTAELRSPAEVEAALDQAMADLDQLGKDYDAAVQRLQDAEENWTAHLDRVIASIEDSLEGRIPGEHRLQSRARRDGDGATLWSEYRQAKREVERIEKQMTRVGNVISASQTKLKQVRAENGGSY